MPRRKLKMMRTTPNRDIEAVRKIIADGIPWLDSKRHYELTRQLTLEQKALLTHLTPFRSAAKFLCELDAEFIESAKRVLDITSAKKRGLRQ